MQAKEHVSGGTKQAESYKEDDENSVTHVSQLESNAYLLSCITSFFGGAAWLTCVHTTSMCHKLSDETQ